jgi:hypothetical protein
MALVKQIKKYPVVLDEIRKQIWEDEKDGFAESDDPDVLSLCVRTLFHFML